MIAFLNHWVTFVYLGFFPVWFAALMRLLITCTDLGGPRMGSLRGVFTMPFLLAHGLVGMAAITLS